MQQGKQQKIRDENKLLSTRWVVSDVNFLV